MTIGVTSKAIPTFAAAAMVLAVTPALGGNFIPNSTEGFRYTERHAVPQMLASGRNALNGLLRDYPTARFRYVFAHFTSGGTVDGLTIGAGWFLCGEVNSKNGFGGYDGWKGFLVMANGAYSEDSDPYYGLCGHATLLSQYDPTHDYSGELTAH